MGTLSCLFSYLKYKKNKKRPNFRVWAIDMLLETL